jgi:hypothetical protein
MRTTWIYLALLLILLPACSSPGADAPTTAISPDLTAQQAEMSGGYVCWATCDFVIARDASEWEVIPGRGADASWGYHLNAVKLLEVSPGKNCINIWKIKLLPSGDLAVDISITHPYNDPCYTGFDVRGIIMFPSSQFLPDNELRAGGGMEPLVVTDWFASHRKGDAELVNPDGYTTIWSPYQVSDQKHKFELEEGYPIFGYYHGRMASGDHVGTINGFKRYYTHKNRHMFQPGYTVTRTFIIRPPAEGPIQASYAVYAHWAPPSVYPVKNPALDFPSEANSPLPYEFWIEQVGPIKPDTPQEVQAESLLWHIKYWHFGIDTWWDIHVDLLGCGYSGGNQYLVEAFDKCPDCYQETTFDTDYCSIPDILPGTWPVVFLLKVIYKKYDHYWPVATDYYIAWLDIEACDDE